MQENMDYEARLVRFEQRYEAEQDAFFSARFDEPELEEQLQARSGTPAYWHQLVVDGAVVDVSDDLATDEDYARRGTLVEEGAALGYDVPTLVWAETAELERLIREKDDLPGQA